MGIDFSNLDPATEVPVLLDAYFEYVNELLAVGAQKILFINLPPTNRSPPYLGQSADMASKMANFINTYNQQLTARILGSWRNDHPEVSIHFLFSAERPSGRAGLIKSPGRYLVLRLLCFHDRSLRDPPELWLSGRYL